MKLLNSYAENVELNKVHIHLTIEGMQDGLKLAETLNKLKDEQIIIKADKVRQKRSLNANNYFYQLVGKIAEHVDASKDEIHNRMLARYGQYLRDKDNNIVFCLYPVDIDYKNATDVHLKPTGHTEKDGSYEWFAVMRGSHTYDSREMAKLIDGVVSEAKELDIETLTPDELKRMVGNGKSQNVYQKDNG